MLLAIVLLVLYQMINHKQGKKIEFFANGIVVWNVWSFGVVELLSCLNLLIRPMVFAGWIVLDCALLILIFHVTKHEVERQLQELKGRM